MNIHKLKYLVDFLIENKESLLINPKNTLSHFGGNWSVYGNTCVYDNLSSFDIGISEIPLEVEVVNNEVTLYIGGVPFVYN